MNTQKTSLEYSHFPVMLSEILKFSSPSKGGTFLDCTFGGGGYSKALLNYSKTKVISFDRDLAVIDIAKKLEKKYQNRFKFHRLRFSQVNKIIKKQVDAVIFDLGISSIQLNNLSRGFSFKSKENLDMKMGLSNFSAQDVVNNLSEQQLKLVIKVLGEEREAAKIAKNIVRERSKKKITRVSELVKIIEQSKKKIFSNKINPSTKTFQALRIFVNKEITELIHGVISATKKLKPGGKILIISFHSLEDRIVKYFFSNFSKNKSKPSRYFPDNRSPDNTLFKTYRNKVFTPSKLEIEKNNRSRSAKLRFAVRSNNRFEYPYDLIKKFKRFLDLEATNV
mgnify:CR=1 FL=1